MNKLYLLMASMLTLGAALAFADTTVIEKTKAPVSIEFLPLPVNEPLPDYMFKQLPEGPIPPYPEPDPILWETK